MVEDLILGRVVGNTALISINRSQSPARGAGFRSMKGGGLEGEDKCDGTEVGKGNHFLFA